MVRGLFRHTPLDALGVATVPFHLAVLAALAYANPRVGWLAWSAVFVLLFLLSLQNTSANHNHHHTPVFHHRLANELLSAGYSMVSGSPKTFGNVAHAFHHARTTSYNEESCLEALGFTRPLGVIRDFAIAMFVQSF